MTQNLISVEPTQILSDWQLTITVDMVLRGQGADPQKIRARQPQLVTLAERAITEGNSLIHPQVAFRRLDICGVSRSAVTLRGGTELNGFGIARKLTGCQGVFLAVATLGKNLEAEMDKASQSDLPWQFALDGLGTAAIGALSNAACRFFAELAAKEGLRSTSQFYPGMRGWPLAEGQTQIFSLVDAHAIGVILNPSFLMVPRKSLSLAAGFGTHAQPAGHICDECSVSTKCRHKPIDR
jgi:hypothetical protein